MRHHLALVACLALTGSLAHAAPGRHAGRHGKVSTKAKHKAKAAPPAEQPDASDEEHSATATTAATDDDSTDTAASADADDESEAPRRTKRSKHKRARTVHARKKAERDTERVAFRGESTDDEVVIDSQDAADDDRAKDQDPPARLRKAATKARTKDWHVAVGPYLWASSVDANVSLGPASVSSGVDFFEAQRHASYGAEVLAEAGYGRFSIYGDLMYGVVGVDGSKEVGPLMVTLNGRASSLLVDGTAGYRLAGSARSLLSLEALGGVRYQRTAISGSVNLAGADISPPEQVNAAADALAGAHVVVRPLRWLSFAGTVDLGVFGASTSTWSAAADAGVRVGKHVQLSLGWRTLTTERPNVSIVMHGPRAAVQLMF